MFDLVCLFDSLGMYGDLILCFTKYSNVIFH